MQRVRKVMGNQKMFWAVLGLLMVLGVIISGYSDWKTHRLMQQTKAFLGRGDIDGAVLMARSAYAQVPQSEEARRLLSQAYSAKQDPRVLDLLADCDNHQLTHTLKAIELGMLPEARRSFVNLIPGHSVDALSYHELGLLLFKDVPHSFLEHAEGTADLNPDEPGGLLRLAMASMRVGTPYPQRHVAKLVEFAREGRSPSSADAAAMALTLSLTSSRAASWPASAVELAGWLQLHIESSATVRPTFLRALEACHGRRVSLEWALMGSMKTLCEHLKSGPDTRQFVECLTRLDRGAELVDWFEASPEAFPPVVPDQPQNAFARLLVADAAADESRWELVSQVVREKSPKQWGELRFLRHFYQGRLIRERPQGDPALVDRERQLLAQAKVTEAEHEATLPWQRAVLAELSRKYL